MVSISSDGIEQLLTLQLLGSIMSESHLLFDLRHHTELLADGLQDTTPHRAFFAGQRQFYRIDDLQVAIRLQNEKFKRSPVI